jgi:hypothetical protein
VPQQNQQIFNVGTVEPDLAGSFPTLGRFAGNGHISGVIDWNYGIARGDRLFGVVKPLHTLSF